MASKDNATTNVGGADSLLLQVYGCGNMPSKAKYDRFVQLRERTTTNRGCGFAYTRSDLEAIRRGHELLQKEFVYGVELLRQLWEVEHPHTCGVSFAVILKDVRRDRCAPHSSSNRYWTFRNIDHVGRRLAFYKGMRYIPVDSLYEEVVKVIKSIPTTQKRSRDAIKDALLKDSHGKTVCVTSNRHLECALSDTVCTNEIRRLEEKHPALAQVAAAPGEEHSTATTPRSPARNNTGLKLKDLDNDMSTAVVASKVNPIAVTHTSDSTSPLYKPTESAHIPSMRLFEYEVNLPEGTIHMIDVEMGASDMIKPRATIKDDGYMLEIVSDARFGFGNSDNILEERQVHHTGKMPTSMEDRKAYMIREARREASIKSTRDMQTKMGENWMIQYTRIPLSRRVDKEIFEMKTIVNKDGKETLAVSLTCISDELDAQPESAVVATTVDDDDSSAKSTTQSTT